MSYRRNQWFNWFNSHVCTHFRQALLIEINLRDFGCLITEQKLFCHMEYNNDFFCHRYYTLNIQKKNFNFHYVDMSVEKFFVFTCLMNKIVCSKNKNLTLAWNHEAGSQFVFQVVTKTNKLVFFYWIIPSVGLVEYYEYFSEKYAFSVRVSDCIIFHWNFGNRLRDERVTKSLLADGYEVSQTGLSDLLIDCKFVYSVY